MKSVPIITKVVSLNSVHGEVYSIQHYKIKVSHLFAVAQWFSPEETTKKLTAMIFTTLVVMGTDYYTIVTQLL